MLMIVLVHVNFVSIGSPNKYDILNAPLTSFWRIFAEQLCVVGVNVFVLISGWFGIKPSAKGLCTILFQVFFWGCIILLLGIGFHLDIPYKETIKVFWFGSYYWFIIAYVVLYILSPVLNTFVERASPRQSFAVIICFFVAEFVYGWIINTEMFNQGYSVISFVGLYLLARFIHLYSHKLQSITVCGDILCYGVFTLIPAFISYFGIRNGWKTFHPLYYSSPFVIAASVSLLLLFSKIKIKNGINGIINWIACSTFSVYLIHFHPIVFPYFMTSFQHLAQSLSPFGCSCVAFLLAFVILLFCVLFDKLRLGSWKVLCSCCLDRLFRNIEETYNSIMQKWGF